MDAEARTALRDGVAAAALEAGAAIWRHFEAGFEVLTKSDESPVTAADHAAEAIILAALARLDPDTPVVAEEEAAAGRIPAVGARFWLVDPLDGTREFVRKGTDFTVNIGLVEGDRPTLGVVYAPARADLFVGDVSAGLAWRARVEPGVLALEGGRPLQVREPGARLVALASRSHGDPVTDRYLAALPLERRITIGSSLKFGLVAAGEADLYPRTGPTMEWDTAAGQAVLEAAGGRVIAPDGSPFRYGKPGFRNGAFVACGPFDAPPLAPFIDG
jgi:3'(2'), 5'-bisphosphate nucleotidase